MPKPTLQNSKFFKEVLKKYRAKFNSQIQTCKLSDLEAIWSTSNRASTYPTGDPDIKVVMMEGGQNITPIDLSSEVTNQQLVYFPATYGDHCVIKMGDSFHELKFPYDDGPVQFGGNSQTETNTWQNVGLGSTITFRSRYSNGRGFSSSTGTVKAYGGALIDFGGGITANIDAPTTAISVNEGGSVDFTITVTGFTGSASQYFDVKWVGHPNVNFTSNGDFTSSAPTYWYFGSSGTLTNTLTLKEDFTSSEGSEYFSMQLVDPNDNSIVLAESPRVTINDTSSGTFTLSVAAAESVTHNVTVQNVSGQNYFFIDSIQAPTLTLEKGKTYIFDQSNNTNTNHPLAFKDASGNPYTTGITSTGQAGQAGANVTYVVPTDAPSSLRYYCTVHGNNMGNTITVGSATSTTEGSPITFHVNTTGVPNNTNLYYYARGTGANNADFGGSSAFRSGYVPISVTDSSTGIGTGSINITPTQDFYTDNGETIYFELYNGYYSYSTLLATSTTITINDLPWTVTVTSDVTTVQEIASGVSDSVTFTFATTGVPNGTTLRCYLEAVGTNSTFKARDVYVDGNTTFQFGDDSFSSRYYDITVNNNAASLKLKVVRDGKTEGDEQFKIVAKGTAYNNTLAESPTITITDSSIVGLNKTGKTFGPVRVNRDNGNAANVSDWYTICNLDKVPDNSKVALFIDTSGSMTMSTIQASYDLLVSKLNARGITFITVQNSQEDWISDFDTPL